MTEQNSQHRRTGPTALRWQSQAVLLAIVPVAAIWVTLEGGQAWAARSLVLWFATVISVVLAALVFSTRAATLGAAITGGIFTAALYLQTPGFHTALWPLLALLLLTFGATRFGRHRKEALGVAEARRGRTASQVAANLGVATLAGIPQIMGQFSDVVFLSPRFTLVPMLAAMAEATADTVSSELGQVLGGEPRLITNLQRVPAGTDGAVSLVGTLFGVVAAAVVVLVGLAVLPLNHRDAVIAVVCGIAGTVLDSFLGALPERRGWLNNDVVNALSTLFAAALAACALRWL
ncbi:MAG: DUF92 domain-containing protein [Acidobacteriaceae bacterium]|jgi:uncharacterized protein (TIGR00297 family)